MKKLRVNFFSRCFWNRFIELSFPSSIFSLVLTWARLLNRHGDVDQRIIYKKCSHQELPSDLKNGQVTTHDIDSLTKLEGCAEWSKQGLSLQSIGLVKSKRLCLFEVGYSFVRHLSGELKAWIDKWRMTCVMALWPKGRVAH
jgi:hypothetical protein